MPSPTKENNIVIKDPEMLEQAINVLKDVNNSNGTVAVEKLLTPDRTKLAAPEKEMNSEDNQNQRKPARRRLRKESSISDVGESNKDDGTKPPRQVLNDDEFQALFATDANASPDKTKDTNNENNGSNNNVAKNPPPAGVPRKRKVKPTAGGNKNAAGDSSTENNGPTEQDKLWTNDLDYK